MVEIVEVQLDDVDGVENIAELLNLTVGKCGEFW